MWESEKVSSDGVEAQFFDCHCGFKSKLYNGKTWALRTQRYYEGAIIQK